VSINMIDGFNYLVTDYLNCIFL